MSLNKVVYNAFVKVFKTQLSLNTTNKYLYLGKPEPHKRELHPEPLDRDEALALRLQHELDREARPVDLEDEGLFFCQLCNKDLSHMTPNGRTQHINRFELIPVKVMQPLLYL